MSEYYESNKERLDWDKYFLAIARMVSSRSTCLKRNVGAVIVKEKHVLSHGYVGAPSGMLDCKQVGFCERDRYNDPAFCVSVHAEMNAIVFAARHGINIKGSTLYTTLEPCPTCLKLAYHAGIKEIVFEKEYNDSKRHNQEAVEYWRRQFGKDITHSRFTIMIERPVMKIRQVELTDEDLQLLSKVFDRDFITKKVASKDGVV